jgi:hypothetical protein
MTMSSTPSSTKKKRRNRASGRHEGPWVTRAF